MKRYAKEMMILCIQLCIFYITPLFVGPTNAIGMMLLMLSATLILSAVLGAISEQNVKFVFPLVVAVIFIPGVWIYYNESALIHSIWYLVMSAVGLLLGVLGRAVGGFGNQKG